MMNRFVQVMPWLLTSLVMASGGVFARTDAPPPAAQSGANPLAEQQVGQPRQANAPEHVVEERKICRQERTLGSNRSTRVCRSQGEMQRRDDQAKDALRSGAVSTP